MLEDLGLGKAVDNNAATRHVKALQELTRGLLVDPTRHLGVQFESVTTTTSLVVVADIPYASLCAHHMLPFWGHATVAYLPNPGAKIVGLSKIARCFQEYAARPQVQERI